MKGRSVCFTKSWAHGGLLIAAAIALANSGCLLVAAGAGAAGAAAGYAYWQGEVCEVYNAAFEDSWAAAHTALGELGMPIVSERKGDGQGHIVVQSGDGSRVRVNVESLPSKVPAGGPMTRIGVRVATFGDRPLSDRVLGQVGLHLAPAGVVPQVPSGPADAANGRGATPPPPLAPAANGPNQPQTAPPPLLPPEPIAVPK